MSPHRQAPPVEREIVRTHWDWITPIAFAWLLASAAALIVVGCTAAQQQEAKTVVVDVETVLSDIQKACVIAQAFTAIDPPVAADVAIACSIDAAAVKAIEAEMAVAGAARAQIVAIELAKPVGSRRVFR